MANENLNLDQLPQECISLVISLTSPRDACVASAVSRNFHSAADSDDTWHRFLPTDYESYISQADAQNTPKKELYFRLPVVIDGGLMSFRLEKSSKAKIFMLSARKLYIAWGNDPRYWNWIDYPDSRFECALLRDVCWLEIRGNINSARLTLNTSYASYLVFKLTENAYNLSYPFQKGNVTIAGTGSEHSVCVDHREREEFNGDGPLPGGDLEEITDDVKLPKHRQDGWLEVELGEFYNGDGMDGEVDMSFMGSCGEWKSGLIVQGIEVRPKH